MYKCNGVDLSSTEYYDLRILVDAYESGEDAVSVSLSRLRPDPNSRMFYPEAVSVYCSLADKGLIVGTKVMNGFLFERLSVYGIDFIHDYREIKKQEEKNNKSKMNHEVITALIAGASGSVITLIATYLVKAVSVLLP